MRLIADIIRETKIKYFVWRLGNTSDRQKRAPLFEALKREVMSRSQRQVRRMEVRKGLI